MDEYETDKIEKFFTKNNLEKFRKGQILIDPNKNFMGVYYLKSGYVKEYGITPQGIETTIHIFTPHSYFPMTWVIDNLPIRYYYEALTPVEAYPGSKAKVLDFLQKKPAVLLELTGRLLKALDKLSLRIEQLANAKSTLRVGSILLFLARHFGIKTDNKVIIQEVFTHKDIASLAGITRETATRELKKFERKGLISNKKRSIIINHLPNFEKEF